jgi:hypothetical protein
MCEIYNEQFQSENFSLLSKHQDVDYIDVYNGDNPYIMGRMATLYI